MSATVGWMRLAGITDAPLNDVPDHGPALGKDASVYMKSTLKNSKDRATSDSSVQHAPFEEFTIKTIDELLGQLEKSKPEGSLVEVTVTDEMYHNPCMQELSTVIVHTESSSGQDSPEELHSVYQFCATCKQAVRIL